jgi:2-polyprenyl-3-methyl-5-hydroxy-6-metoxy-1,4-benzoquinol methylase
VHDLPQIAAAIGRQFARLSRSLAQTAAAGEPPAPGVLQPPFGNLEISDWVRAMQLWREHGAALVRDQPPRACPACGATDSRLLFYSFDSYPYVDCLSCATWYVPLVVDERLFDRYYQVCPEAREVVERLAGQRMDEPRAQADRARLSTYFAEIEPLLPPELHDILDVGCGVGHSLDVAAARGWRACGIDSSPDLIRAGRQRGLTIFHPDERLERGSFGLISLWETLEHINDPFALLSDLVPRLHDEGLVAITVPNVLAIEARVMRQDLSWINGGAIGTVHINLFQRASLHRLLSRVGLEIVGVDGEYSFNSYELASYFLGGHRGAWDYARGARVEPNLPEDAICFLNWVGPVWNVLARQLLLTPIIKVIATKPRSADALARIRTIYARARRDEMIAELDRVYPEPS